jgi:hypothetical protein
LDFLRDQIWQFIGVIITVIGITLSIGFSLKQRSRKKLTYDFEGTPLVSVKNKAKDKIQILYNFERVSDAYFLLLKVWNSGNVPIHPSDYLDPIRFTFGKQAEILSCEVVETKPENIKKKVSITQGKQELSINPLLLNQGAGIVIKLVLSAFDGEVNGETLITGLDRIRKAGASNIDRINSSLAFSLFPMMFIMAPLLIIFNAVLLLTNPTDQNNVHSGAIFFIMQAVAIILAGSFIVFERLQWYKSREKFNKLI